MKNIIPTLTAMLFSLLVNVTAQAQISGESEAFTFDTLQIPIPLSYLALAITLVLMGVFLVRRYHLLRKKAGG